jgi:hypothetical protein
MKSTAVKAYAQMEHNVKINSNCVKWTELAPGFVENVMNPTVPPNTCICLNRLNSDQLFNEDDES